MAVRVKYAELGARVVLVDDVEGAAALLPAGEEAPCDRQLHRLPARRLPTSSASPRREWLAFTRVIVHHWLAFHPGDSSPSAGVERPLRIVHLYPDALNLYGDGGNIASLSKRCAWRGIPCRVEQVLMGQELDLSDADVVLLGGGADRDQLAVCHELQRPARTARRLRCRRRGPSRHLRRLPAARHSYMMGTEKVEGLHILDLETVAGATRLIGNVAIESPVCATPIVGFENHAGRTLLGAGEKPLGRALVAGTGNNGEDGGRGRTARRRRGHLHSTGRSCPRTRRHGLADRTGAGSARRVRRARTARRRAGDRRARTWPCASPRVTSARSSRLADSFPESPPLSAARL